MRPSQNKREVPQYKILDIMYFTTRTRLKANKTELQIMSKFFCASPKYYRWPLS